MGHAIANACGVPLGARTRDTFNAWLWSGVDPSLSAVRRHLQPLQRFANSVLESWRYPNPTATYLAVNSSGEREK